MADQVSPLTAAEKEQFDYLKAATSDQVDTVRLAAARVLHDGKERVALVAVRDVGDEYEMTPLALLIDDDLFAAMEPPDGAVPNPTRVERDDDDALGPCGCVDYHYADCPLRTGG